MDDEQAIDAVELATELTMAWLGNPNSRLGADDVPAFLRSVFDTISALAGSATDTASSKPAQEFVSAVTARKSLGSPEHIISMIDGKPHNALRRHLSGHGPTLDDYRVRYRLKADYPMVAPVYSETRRPMAKKIGLGRKPGTKMPAKALASAPAPAPAKRTRAKGPAARRATLKPVRGRK
jgi:predicted transcriptional regulator